MRELTVGWCCAVLMFGCSSVYTVGPKGTGAEYDFPDANRSVENRECTVDFVTGEQKQLNGIVLSSDSVSWVDGSFRMRVAASQVSIVQPAGPSQKVITFANGQRRVFDNVVATNDSVRWTEPRRFSVPASQVAKIGYINHGQGFVEGLLIGVLAGGAATAVMVAGSSGGHTDGVARGFIAVLVGGGTLVGSIVASTASGHRFEFDLPATRNTKSRSTDAH